MPRILAFLLAAVGVLVLGVAITIAVLDESKPTGEAGPAADDLARRMVAWTQPEGWAQTGAIQWNFGGRNQHLWDRQRRYARVEWGSTVVLLRLDTQSGIVREDGVTAKGARASELLQQAYAKWVNDAFWLHPFDGIFGPSVVRSIVKTPDRGDGLLVTYQSGGVTPGDSYLWFVDADGRPTAYKMWVSIIPVGGLEVSWDDWIDLPTGAKISTLHKGPIELRLTDIKGAENLDALLAGQPDPFVELTQTTPTSQPASLPYAGTATAAGGD